MEIQITDWNKYYCVAIIYGREDTLFFTIFPWLTNKLDKHTKEDCPITITLTPDETTHIESLYRATDYDCEAGPRWSN